jgi:hypothetical protein
MNHTYRVAKTAFILTSAIILVSLVGGLIYLNKVGFPGAYGDRLRSELGDRGLHLSFESLRFDLKRGLVATNVSFYPTEDHLTPLLEAGEITLDLDKTKALRGKFKLLNIQVTNGTARIPVDENGRMVTARDINGALMITESGRATVHETSGLIEGIRVTLSADLKLVKDLGEDLPQDQQKALQSNHVLSLILDELALWSIPPETPPALTFKIKGDLKKPERLTTAFSLNAVNLTRNDYHLDQLQLSGDLQSQLVTLDDILLEDESGSASGQADWSVTRREGRFDVVSDLQLQDFLQSCFGITVLKNLTLETPPVLKLIGTYTAPDSEKFSVRATGHGSIGEFRFLETPFTGLTSDFSWHDGDLYLRDLEVKHQSGQLNGSLLLEKSLARYDVRSTLPLEAFRPFIKPGKSIDRIVEGLKFAENSIVALDVVGSSDRTDLTSWSALGKAHFTNFTYRGARFHHLGSSFNFIPGQTEFSEITALLNDDREPARLRYRGDPSEELYADRILFDPDTRITTISNLRGKVWPTPIIRIFTPTIAEHLEKNYRFHKAPHLVLNGNFAGRKEDRELTLFSVAAKTDGRTDYPFLGKDLPLQNLIADVVVRGAEITTKNISAATLGGSISGSVVADVTSGKKTTYQGAMKWDQLSFPLISRTYEFEDEEKGTLTGSIDFNGTADGIQDFNADGLIGITKGNLVSLPVLGPLSPVIAGVLGDKRMGYERAKDASSTFAIRQGVAQTKDFVATSTSIVLTGEGWIDLDTEKMDMTVRVNARGLLGLLTMPLKPFKGIFQFRGTGLYSAPLWRSSPFIRPAKGNADPLFQKAGKAEVVRE